MTTLFKAVGLVAQTLAQVEDYPGAALGWESLLSL
jgi:hypothetical protein